MLTTKNTLFPWMLRRYTFFFRGRHAIKKRQTLRQPLTGRFRGPSSSATLCARTISKKAVSVDALFCQHSPSADIFPYSLMQCHASISAFRLSLRDSTKQAAQLGFGNTRNGHSSRCIWTRPRGFKSVVAEDGDKWAHHMRRKVDFVRRELGFQAEWGAHGKHLPGDNSDL